MKRLVLALLFAATSLHAQVVATTSRGVAVAHDQKLQLFDNNRLIWSSEGATAPSVIVVGRDRIALLDSLNNRVRIADLATGRGEERQTGETPIDGIFVGGDLFILERDAKTLQRFGPGGSRGRLTLASDPVFIRESGGMLYVYSRLEGVVQEISPSRMAITRRFQLAPFASDFEVAGSTGYLVFPREAKLRLIDLKAMKRAGDIDAGAVPMDVAITRGSNALSATGVTIADPSAKRIWTIEGRQSLTAAVTRGFLRGLLGLGLFAPRSSDFPTGVDRVFADGFAYDTTTGTIYRSRRGKVRVVAKGVAPYGFAVTNRGIMVWKDGTLHLLE